MKLFAQGVQGVVVTLLTCVNLVAGANSAPMNRREFRALCWFFKIAGSSSKYTTNPASFFEAGAPWNGLDEIFMRVERLGLALNESEKGKPIKIEEGPEDYLALPGSIPSALKARLSKYLEKYRQTGEELNKSREEAYKLVKDAATELTKAQFGQVTKEQATSAGSTSPLYKNSNTNRQNVCKGAKSIGACTAHGSLNAGCSLAHDMICLCETGQTNADYKSACGVQLGGTFYWSTSSMTSEANLNTDWQKLEGHCRQLDLPTEFSEKNIHEATQNFEGLLGAQVAAASSLTSADNFQWVLGKTLAASGNACNGATSTNGACVDYGTGSANERGENSWLKAFGEAARKLTAANANRAAGERQERQSRLIWFSIQNLVEQANLVVPTQHQGAIMGEPSTVFSTGTTNNSVVHGHMPGRDAEKLIRQNWFPLISLFL